MRCRSTASGNWMHVIPRASGTPPPDRSFVFFRITGLGNRGQTIGGQGVRFTPGRSIAVDVPRHIYGTPFYIEADLPLESATSTIPFRRLMIAQDTGSAITGPARADIFFGAGDEAGRAAGRFVTPAGSSCWSRARSIRSRPG